LLRPRSIAVVGASARPGSVGATILAQLRRGGFAGTLALVNPRYGKIDGLPCHASLDALDRPVEHVVFAVPDTAIEAEFRRAADAGIRAATIMSPLLLDGDNPRQPLKERIRAIADEAGILLCGGNCMGFYNFADRVLVCGFPTRDNLSPGGVTLVTHSGSVFVALIDAEERIAYNLAVSSGQELNVTLADYMDFALEQPDTRVIGLFMEAARDPAGFEAVLAKADDRGIPVIVVKVGRTEAAARFARSHSGALAGTDAAYQAMFDRYSVTRVASIDDLAMALMVFEAGRDIGPGGLATSHDSGGERGLIVDLAANAGVPFAAISGTTTARLAQVLDIGLDPVNPLDHWATGRNYPDDFRDSFLALMADPDTALGALVLDRGPGGSIFPEYLDCARAARSASPKPVFIVSNYQGSGHDPEAIVATRAGTPVLDGVPAFLRTVRHLLDWRDRWQGRLGTVPAPPDSAAAWTAGRRPPADEATALDLLADFGIPVVAHRIAETGDAAVAAAVELGLPAVLKTAMPGIAHKSDFDGVRLDLHTPEAVAAAYADMAARLGTRILVQPMVTGHRVEMILGMTRDEDFGPVVVIGIGGIHAEMLADVVFARPPVDASTARRLVDRLKLRALLDGPRGAPPVDIDALCETIARFSVLATHISGDLASIDVNPLFVCERGCIAVDALIVWAAAP
jgi:acyl-CoA synthetase (NDP forming)